ncbi:MAG: YfhO family protein, partial [Acidobacteriota bacterium]
LLLGRGSWSSVALLAVSLALMILAGAFELVVPFVAYGAAELLLAFFDKASGTTGPPARYGHRMLPRMGWVILAGGIAAGLAACQLLPTFELFWFSSRSSGLPISLSSIWSLHPGRLLELVAPHLFGNAAVEVPWTALLRPSVFANHPFLAGIYVGVPTLALALGGFRRLIPRHTMFLAAMLLTTLLLSLGDETPLFGLVRELLPGVALFRYPAKFFTLTMIPIAILAAAGADGLLRGRKEIRRLVLMGALGLAILLLLCSLLGLVCRDGIVEWIGEGIARENLDLDQIEVWHQAMAALLRGLVTALIFLTAAVMMDRTPRPLKLPLLCLLILLDLGLANRTLVATTSTDAHLSRPPSLPAAEQFHEASGTVRIGHSLPGTANLLYEPHLLLLQGYRVADSYGSMQLASEAVFEIELREHPVRLLQLRSARFALDRGQGAEPFQVRKVADSLPRALVIPTATAALDDQFGARYLRSPDFDPRREVILSDIPLEVLEWVDPSNRIPSPGGVLMTVDEPNEIRLEAQAEAASYLLLNDSWFPGWQATVNGRQVPIHRANLMFRAVQIPAGRSEVIFTYRPQSVRAGLQVSGLSLLLLGWLFWESYRARKGQRSD